VSSRDSSTVPTIWRVVTTDAMLTMPLLLICAAAGIALFVWASYSFHWAVPVRADLAAPSALQVVVATVLITSPMSVPVACWIALTRRVLATGAEADGRVLSIREIRGGVRVDYELAVSGARRRGWALATSMRAVRHLSEGQRVKVRYWRRHPHLSFIQELYIP
jgi:hypothetical protein